MGTPGSLARAPQAPNHRMKRESLAYVRSFSSFQTCITYLRLSIVAEVPSWTRAGGVERPLDSFYSPPLKPPTMMVPL